MLREARESAERPKRKMKLAKYGYGIVDQDGQAWWSEMCVCIDRTPLDDVVQEMNDWRMGRPDEPRYKVVALYRQVEARRTP